MRPEKDEAEVEAEAKATVTNDCWYYVS